MKAAGGLLAPLADRTVRGRVAWWDGRPQCADMSRCFDRAYKQATREASR